MSRKIQSFLFCLLIIEICCSEDVPFEKIRRKIRQTRHELLEVISNRTSDFDNCLKDLLSKSEVDELKGQLNELKKYSKGLRKEEPVMVLLHLREMVIPKLLTNFEAKGPKSEGVSFYIYPLA